jgi:hypothetical protein
MVVVSLLNSRLWEISGSYFSWKRSYSTIDDGNDLVLAGLPLVLVNPGVLKPNISLVSLCH